MSQQHSIATKRFYHSRRMIKTLLCVCLCLTGCTKEDYDAEPVRTILFYMGGDNNLSSEAIGKIECLKSVKVPPGCHLLVYADTGSGNPQLSEWRMESGEWRKAVVREYEESNSASYEVFGRVLREVQELYPSPSYGLVVFSHATGWLPQGTYNNPNLLKGADAQSPESLSRDRGNSRSVLADNGAEMEIADFAAAIPDKMLNFIIFETCLMAGIEVAYELKDKTDYIIASSAEIVSPGFSPAYSNAIPLLFQTKPDLAGFCMKVKTDYHTRTGDYGSLTLSLILTNGLDALATTLNNCIMFSAKEVLVHCVTISNREGAIQSFDRNNRNLFFDFGDYFGRYIPENEAVSLQKAIDNCVVYKTATADFMPTYGGFTIDKHSGLTTYIPQEKYSGLNEAYKKLKWYKAITN